MNHIIANNFQHIKLFILIQHCIFSSAKKNSKMGETLGRVSSLMLNNPSISMNFKGFLPLKSTELSTLPLKEYLTMFSRKWNEKKTGRYPKQSDQNCKKFASEKF